MHSEHTKPDQLHFAGTLTIDALKPDTTLSAVECLQAVAFADFREIYIAASRGYPLSDKQACAVRRIKRDKSGRLVELTLRDRAKALAALGKALVLF